MLGDGDVVEEISRSLVKEVLIDGENAQDVDC
jgi:hypothetical protein